MTVLDGQSSLVVLLDCMEGVAKGNLPDASQREHFTASVTDLLEIAERNGIPVIRVDVEFRPDHLEVAPANRYFSGVKAAGRLVAGSVETEPMHEFAERVIGYPRVVKKRIGAFAGSDIEWVLRGLGRTHLILAGLITRGAVLSTACQAADLDYSVTVISDACHDPDPEVQRVLIDSVLPIRASVTSTTDLKRLEKEQS